MEIALTYYKEIMLWKLGFRKCTKHEEGICPTTLVMEFALNIFLAKEFALN